jgi:peptidoglycan-associated lipoprotein
MVKRVSCAVIVAVLLGGCTDNKPTSLKPKTPLDSAFKSHWEKGAAGTAGEDANNGDGLPPVGQDASVETGNLHVSDAIVRACNLPRPSVNPNFEFDSSTIGPDDKVVLAALAKCLTDGALKGRAVSLVGRCDPRGEMEYNMSLGGARADSVKRYLGDMGIEAKRVSASSRGELDATGTDEATWAVDRRVDIDLQQK